MRQMIAPDLERRCFQGEIFLEKVGVPCTQQRVDDIILDFFSGKPDHLEELLVSGNFHLVPVPSMSGCNMKLAGICKQGESKPVLLVRFTFSEESSLDGESTSKKCCILSSMRQSQPVSPKRQACVMAALEEITKKTDTL